MQSGMETGWQHKVCTFFSIINATIDRWLIRNKSVPGLSVFSTVFNHLSVQAGIDVIVPHVPASSLCSSFERNDQTLLVKLQLNVSLVHTIDQLTCYYTDPALIPYWKQTPNHMFARCFDYAIITLASWQFTEWETSVTSPLGMWRPILEAWSLGFRTSSVFGVRTDHIWTWGWGWGRSQGRCNCIVHLLNGHPISDRPTEQIFRWRNLDVAPLWEHFNLWPLFLPLMVN